MTFKSRRKKYIQLHRYLQWIKKNSLIFASLHATNYPQEKAQYLYSLTQIFNQRVYTYLNESHYDVSRTASQKEKMENANFQLHLSGAPLSAKLDFIHIGEFAMTSTDCRKILK